MYQKWAILSISPKQHVVLTQIFTIKSVCELLSVGFCGSKIQDVTQKWDWAPLHLHCPKFICTVPNEPIQAKMAILTQNFFVLQNLYGVSSGLFPKCFSKTNQAKPIRSLKSTRSFQKADFAIQFFAMTSSSVGKFDLKIQRNCKLFFKECHKVHDHDAYIQCKTHLK